MHLDHPNPGQRAQAQQFIDTTFQVTQEWRRCFGASFTNELHWAIFTLIMNLRRTDTSVESGQQKFYFSFSYLCDFLPRGRTLTPDFLLDKVREAEGQYLTERGGMERRSFEPTGEFWHSARDYVSYAVNRVIDSVNRNATETFPKIEVVKSTDTISCFMRFWEEYADSWRETLLAILRMRGFSSDESHRLQKHLFSAIRWHVVANVYAEHSRIQSFERDDPIGQKELSNRVHDSLHDDLLTIQNNIDELKKFGIIRLAGYDDCEPKYCLSPEAEDLLTAHYERALGNARHCVEEITDHEAQAPDLKFEDHEVFLR